MVQFLSLYTSSSSSLLHCILNMTQWLLYTGQEQDHCMVSLSLSKHAVTWEADYIRCKFKLNDLSSLNRWCKFWQHHLFAAKCILFLINWLKIYTVVNRCSWQVRKALRAWPLTFSRLSTLHTSHSSASSHSVTAADCRSRDGVQKVQRTAWMCCPHLSPGALHQWCKVKVWEKVRDAL